LRQSFEHAIAFVRIGSAARLEHLGDAAGIFDQLEIHASGRFDRDGNDVDFEFSELGGAFFTDSAAEETEPDGMSAESADGHGDVRGFSTGQGFDALRAIDRAGRERSEAETAIERGIRADANDLRGRHQDLTGGGICVKLTQPGKNSNKKKRIETASPGAGFRMLSEERRRKIVELVQRDGRVFVTDLARRFRTSLITIRKDLESLHQEGRLHRAHGGALPVDGAAQRDPSLHEKERLHRKEKLRIAQAAARLVQAGQVIILDSGTTTTAVARAVKNTPNLTVVTNAVNIAAELAGTDVEVLLTGGTLRKNSFSLVGPLAEDSLRKITADLLFLAVDGFDVDYGLTTPNLLEAKVNRVMMESAKATVVVCDSSKFGRRSLSLIASTRAVHHAITDKGISPKDLRALRKAGVKVITV
jgi:DeoR family transcriptional regulator, aga operon transcriptional repressor